MLRQCGSWHAVHGGRVEALPAQKLLAPTACRPNCTTQLGTPGAFQHVAAPVCTCAAGACRAAAAVEEAGHADSMVALVCPWSAQRSSGATAAQGRLMQTGRPFPWEELPARFGRSARGAGRWRAAGVGRWQHRTAALGCINLTHTRRHTMLTTCTACFVHRRSASLPD